MYPSEVVYIPTGLPLGQEPVGTVNQRRFRVFKLYSLFIKKKMDSLSAFTWNNGHGFQFNELATRINFLPN